jgi:DNA helicase II / ATP-dependent DNA helicase PcrA
MLTKMNLTKEQLEVIQSIAPFKLVIAGPGSGKTTVLAATAESFVDPGTGGLNPVNMTVITYTNSAAAELASRLSFKPGFLGTLHGFCLQLCREHFALVNLPEKLTVLDDEARWQIVQSIAKEMGIKVANKELEAALKEDVVRSSSLSKAQLVTLEYQLRCQANGLLDFDSILWFALQIVKKADPATWQWQHIFWDEAQDMGLIDWRLLNGIPATHKFVVGDPDQGIFGFRGGNIRMLVEVANAAEACANEFKLFRLQHSYRCPPEVCHCAQHLIEHNTMRVSKLLVPVPITRFDSLVTARELEDSVWEKSWVKDLVMDALGKYQPEQCAILVRTNHLASVFAAHLSGYRIPVAGSEPRERDIPGLTNAKLLIAALANPHNEFATMQYLVSRYGEEQAEKFRLNSHKQMVQLSKYVFGDCAEAASRLNYTLTLVDISLEVRAMVARAATNCAERGLGNDLGQLLIALEEPLPDEAPGITVTTLHKAKGREWNVVFLPAWEEGILPWKLGRTDKIASKRGDIEEERRLAFMGLTRAKDQVWVSWAKTRAVYRGPNYLWPTKEEPVEPSRFIKEAGLA